MREFPGSLRPAYAGHAVDRSDGLHLCREAIGPSHVRSNVTGGRGLGALYLRKSGAAVAPLSSNCVGTQHAIWRWLLHCGIARIATLGQKAGPQTPVTATPLQIARGAYGWHCADAYFAGISNGAEMRRQVSPKRFETRENHPAPPLRSPD